MKVTYHNVLSLLDRTALDSSDTDPSYEIVIVDRGYEKLKISVLVALGRRNIVKNFIEKRLQISALNIGRFGCRSRSSRAEKDRTVKLFVICTKIYKKLKHLVHDLIKTRVGLVYFIYNNDNSVVELKRSLKNEAGLGHRSFRRVNEQNNAVYHFEYTLDLASEIGVSGSVDNIYLYTLIRYCRVFGKNGDSSFALKVV